MEELAALGVARPSAVPLFYRVAAGQLTQSRRIQVLGPDSSGEAEPVLVGTLEAMGKYLIPGTPLAGERSPEEVRKVAATLKQ